VATLCPRSRRLQPGGAWRRTMVASAGQVAPAGL